MDTQGKAAYKADACVPPCPVADGAMGLLCTCGNVVKRWQVTSAMLTRQAEASRFLHRQEHPALYVCRHCGASPDADGDHSCPCPSRDEECCEHPA